MDENQQQQAAQQEHSGVEQDPQAAAPQGNDRLTKVLSQVALAARKVLYADPRAATEFGKMIESAGDPLQGVTQVAVIIFDKILSSPAKGISQQTLFSVAGVASAVAAIEFAADRELLKPDEKTVPAVIQMMGQQGGQAAPGQEQQEAEPGAEPGAEAGGLVSSRLPVQQQQGV